jgi:sirohydrochlorin ferrochelatase
VDLPRAVAAVRAAYPDVAVRVGEAIGPHQALADALIACAERAQPLADWRQALPDPSRFCRANPRCPLFGTSACPESREHA